MESCLISAKDSMKMLKNSIKKSRNIFCFTCIVKEFNEEKDKLEAERITMWQHFQVAMDKGESIQSKAKFWEEQADKLIQEDTAMTKQKCIFGLCPDCIWQYKRGEDLAKRIKEIKTVIEQREKFENVELIHPLPGVERYSSQYFISFNSREMKHRELLDALIDDSNYITGLQGMGGTGKTTLANEVGKQLKILKHFDYVIDTTISFTPDIKKIQYDIAGPLGLQLGDINESDRPRMLWHRLTNGEKILLILDDVWENLNFDYIGIPKSDNHKGCKVLVTTRNLRVCYQMVCEKTIQLELLTEEDAWIMFKMYANLSNISSKSILDKGRKISTECKRLPVAIATIASSLKGQTQQEIWDVTLKSLQKPVVSMDGVDDDFVDIYKSLKFSYDNLRDEKDKRLFLLCSVFREDEEIPVEVLTRLGVGVGLFGEDYACYDDARNQAVSAKDKLLNSCLLLETEKGDVKMHNLLREVAQWIAKKEILAVNFSNKNQKSLVERDKNVKYLLCEGNLKDLFSSEFHGKLEILIVNMNISGTVDIPISFFGSISGLRVLNLLNKSINLECPTLSLPQSITLLKDIRSLLVERVYLGDISILGSLHSLETLDLFQCQIEELPHEIEKLKKLRLLNLDKCEIRSNNPFEVIQRCTSLEELYFCNSFNNFCQEITLPALRRYHLTDSFSMMNNSPSKCVSFQQEYFSEATYKYVMQTAEILKLERIEKGWRNLMPEIVPIDQGMNDLIELHLKFDSKLQCLIDTKLIDSQVTSVFSNLVVLHLTEIENLEELCNGPFSFDSMNNLEELTIECCQHLRSLFKCSPNLYKLKSVILKSCSTLVSVFDLSTSRSLLQLESLVIFDCEKLESIITYERRVDDQIEKIVDDYDNDSKSCNSMFPKLKVVNIKGCPQLQCILPFLSAQDLLLLKTIKIKSCNQLEYIFGQYQEIQLASLEAFELADLPNFIDICPAMPSSISKDGSKPKAQLDPIKGNIFSWTQMCCYRYKLRSTEIPLVSENQPQDCSISLESNLYWERAQCISRQSNILCYIKKIELFDISKIKSVFILSTAPKMLLETLTISKCDELKHIIIDTGGDYHGSTEKNNLSKVFPKLKVINISNCMKLEHIIGHYDDGHENRTEIHLHFSALECLILCKLPSLNAVCPKQYCTTFPPLKQLELNECSQFAFKSIGDFITTSADRTTNKEFSGNVKNLLALEILKVYNSEVENLFFLNEENGEQKDFGLRKIELGDLPMMMSLFVGPKNSFDLKNLTWIKIKRCEKLKFVFSTSVLRCLPQLVNLRIEECEDLEHIIECEDLENEISSNFMSTKTVCFPKLKTLVVVRCNKLEYVFPISICKELPELEALTIREADELEEIFKSESDQKVKIPNLKFVVIVNLPSLSQAQGIQFQTVKHLFVQNCQIPLTSTNRDIELNLDFGEDYELYTDLLRLFEQLREESKSHDTSNENPSTKFLAVENEVEAASRHGLTSSQELMNGESTEQPYLMNQQHPLEETDATVKPSKGIEITVEEGTTSTNAKTITSSTHLEFEYGDGKIAIPSFQISTTEPLTVKDVDLEDSQETNQINNNQVSLNDVDSFPIASISQFPSTCSKGDPSQTAAAEHEIVENVQDLEILSVALFPTSSEKLINPQHPLRGIDEHIEPSQGKKVDVDSKIGMTSFSIVKTETNDKVSLNDDAVMKVRSNIEDQFPNDDGILVSKLRSSSIASKFPSMPSKGDTSHTVQDLSSSLLVKRELEQLVSKNHLDYDYLSLLTDFLVNHPSILLRDTSLSNRYKGYAYNCLAELLKFLQTHSVLDVLGSSHSEFVELLQDVHKCGFHKDLLDIVENRPLFPGLHDSKVASQNFLESKHKLTQHVEDLKYQLASSKAVLESITQQEGQMLETWAALTGPIGY